MPHRFHLRTKQGGGISFVPGFLPGQQLEFNTMSHLQDIEKKKKTLQEEKKGVKRKLSEIKNKLDILFEEKVKLDKDSAAVTKEIEDLKNKCNSVDSKSSQSAQNGINDEELKIVVEELSAVSLEKNQVKIANDELDLKCKDMEKKFEHILNLNHDKQIGSDSFLEKLEIIRREKEAIIKNDEEIEMDNQNLWIEAREIKHQMEVSSSINQQLEVDSEEMNEIFKKINDERGKLIQQDKLLNDRYSVIYGDIQEVCQERMELQLKMDGNITEKDKNTYLQQDLLLAVKQKDCEKLFDNWKSEKETLLKDNRDLDGLLDNLLLKFELLKQKKADIQSKMQDLTKESDNLKLKFSDNEGRKNAVIKQFSDAEKHMNDIVHEVTKYYETNTDESNNQNDIQSLLEEFEMMKKEKERLSLKDEEIMTRYNNVNSRFESLAKQNTSENDKQDEDIDNKLSVLINRKEQILKQDEIIALKFEEFDKEIEELQKTKQILSKSIEDIDWESCLQGNNLDQ